MDQLDLLHIKGRLSQQDFNIDPCYGYCFVCVRNGACLCALCVAGVIQTGIVQSSLSPFLVKYGQIYSALYWIVFFCVWVCVCLCILWSKMRRATTLRCSASDSDTLWASSGPLGGGWVHRVNYTSSPLVWFITLITVGSLKKEKGEEAYKIKKRQEVPQWQRELYVSARGGCWFARAWHCLLP